MDMNVPFNGVCNGEQVSELKTQYDYLLIEDFPSLQQGEDYYPNCGLSVMNENEIKSGIITVILETGVNDVCISRENSEKGNFLPIFPSVLQGTNLELVNVHSASGSTDHYG